LTSALAGACVLAGCGGGGDAGSSPSAPPSAGPTLAQRTAAATAVAQSASNACAQVAPFYWEIGDRSAALASATVAAAIAAPGTTAWRADSSMAIASASKWLYASYVAERRAGSLSAADIKSLNFRSGYSSFIGCARTSTIDQCLATPAANGRYTAADDGFFAYGGGHMQKHASDFGLGGLDAAALATEVRRVLGNDLALSYNQAQPAGGVETTPQAYSLFLRKLLRGDYRLLSQLGQQPVCTNPATCASARNTPIWPNESWSYSLGHWIENDPAVGDGAFSSAGAFGFYPWVDASKTWYGVLAREDRSDNASLQSVACGRLIRKAWVTGVGP
jgi:hypothetical protein